MAAVDTEYDELWSGLQEKRMKLLARRALLEADLSEVTTQIAHINEIMIHLGPLAGLPNEENISSMGITDAVRWILCNTLAKMSPTDVRDKLLEKGFDMSSLTAPMASIYKILSRLAADNKPEVLREKSDDGKVYYMWIRPNDEDIQF
jgi:hypothetical protein